MDGHQKVANQSTLAPLVRQFAPSRIERQLLARALECVVTTRHEGAAAQEQRGSEEGCRGLAGVLVGGGRRVAA